MDTYLGMEKVYKENPDKIKAIGVSNCSVSYLERLLQKATVIPAMNQIELHPSCRTSPNRTREVLFVEDDRCHGLFPAWVHRYSSRPE